VLDSKLPLLVFCKHGAHSYISRVLVDIFLPEVNIPSDALAEAGILTPLLQRPNGITDGDISLLSMDRLAMLEHVDDIVLDLDRTAATSTAISAKDAANIASEHSR